MGWLQNYINLLFTKNEYEDIENLLKKEWSIPKSEIEDIKRLDEDDDSYTVLLSNTFITEDLIKRFLEYNDKYEIKRNDEKFSVYLEGPEGKFMVDEIYIGSQYKLNLSYFDDKIRSDAKVRLDFLSDLSMHKHSGDFKFIEKREIVQ
jgi:hypothetical protein